MLARPVVLRPGGQDDPEPSRILDRGHSPSGPRRAPRGGAAAGRRRARGPPDASGSVSRNVSRSRSFSGPRAVSRPSGMIETDDGERRLDLRSDRRPSCVRCCRPRSVGPRRCGGSPLRTRPSASAIDMRDVIGVDGGARRVDVAEHRGVIAVDQVREVGADLAAPAADLVAGRALRLLAEEEVARPRTQSPPSARGCRGRRSSRTASRGTPRAGGIVAGAERGAALSSRSYQATFEGRLAPPVAIEISTGSGCALPGLRP